MYALAIRSFTNATWRDRSARRLAPVIEAVARFTAKRNARVTQSSNIAESTASKMKDVRARVMELVRAKTYRQRIRTRALRSTRITSRSRSPSARAAHEQDTSKRDLKPRTARCGRTAP